jgi:excisionase family DNA binding protein
MKNKNDFPIVLNAKDICEILKISKPTAYELMGRKEFPLLKFGRSKRVFRDEFFEYLLSIKIK